MIGAPLRAVCIYRLVRAETMSTYPQSAAAMAEEPNSARKIFNLLPAPQRELQGAAGRLTSREINVRRALAQGLPNAEMTHLATGLSAVSPLGHMSISDPSFDSNVDMCRSRGGGVRSPPQPPSAWRSRVRQVETRAPVPATRC
jgi:hypothetical protein